MTTVSVVFLLFLVLGAVRADFTLSVIHINDFHARFEPQSPQSTTCKNISECHGGIARAADQIKKLKAIRPNPIILNAGDNFQGTLYYNLFKYEIVAEFMNMIPFDAYTIGNHEFDDGIDGLVPFLDAMNSTMICSNLDDSKVPSFQGKYKKSVVVEVDGKKIGIVGVILQTTNEISNSEEMIFLDEVENVNAEAKRLVEQEEVFTVVVLSHSGYDVEQYIAKEANEYISLIVGAHSHTFLYPEDEVPPFSIPAGPYPTVINRKSDNGTVLVVQASCYTRYLGDITIIYNNDGSVKSWDGRPIFLSPELPEDQEFKDKLVPYTELVNEKGNAVLGVTEVFLDQSKCRTEECNIGNMITDAYVFEYEGKGEGSAWTKAAISVMNAGGIRASIDRGDITYNDMVTCQPFESTVDYAEIEGKYIREFLEDGGKPYGMEGSYQSSVNLLQLSGIRVTYNLTREPGDRVVRAQVRCADCLFGDYADLDDEKWYPMSIPSFLVNGGDGFTSISENLRNLQRGPVDMEVFERYLAAKSPIKIEAEGRILFIGDERPVELRRHLMKF